MNIILCHQTVDFDALGSAIGLSRLKSGAKIVLTGGAHPAVKNFLALYRDEFTFAQMRSIQSRSDRHYLYSRYSKKRSPGCSSRLVELAHRHKILRFTIIMSISSLILR